MDFHKNMFIPFCSPLSSGYTKLTPLNSARLNQSLLLIWNVSSDTYQPFAVELTSIPLSLWFFEFCRNERCLIVLWATALPNVYNYHSWKRQWNLVFRLNIIEIQLFAVNRVSKRKTFLVTYKPAKHTSNLNSISSRGKSNDFRHGSEQFNQKPRGNARAADRNKRWQVGRRQ